MGAPQKHDRATMVPAICARLATGKEPMTVICADLGVPVKTVNDWRLTDEAIRAQFDEARELGFDAIAMDCMIISDYLNEDPASRRIRVDTRMKLLAKWDPRRYGDKQAIEHSGPGGGPIETRHVDLSGLSDAAFAELERLAARTDTPGE